MNYETVPAETFGHGLKAISINLLVRDLLAEVGFLTHVFAMQSHRVSRDFDGLRGAVLGQQGKQVSFPISFKRVCDGAAMPDLAVGWQRRIGANAAGSAFAAQGAGPSVPTRVRHSTV